MIEQTIDASADAVGQAFKAPEEIARWFGWDYDGLEAEIRFIFVEHSRWKGPHRLEGEEGTVIEIDDRGGRTVVRVARPEVAPGYDPIEEGWRAFLAQLAFALERHPGASRRTLRVSGDKAAADVVAALPEGEVRLDGEYVLAVDEGGALAVVDARDGLAADRPGPVAVTISFYGENGDADAWAAWWEEIG